MAKKKRNKNRKKKVQEEVWTEDDIAAAYGLAYIAGYTAGGIPYGLTIEEMEEMEKRMDFVDDGQTSVKIKKKDNEKDMQNDYVNTEFDDDLPF